MLTLSAAQKCYCRAAALALALSTTGLTGCSDTPHDRIDNAPPAKMTPLPTSATITAEKPAEAPVSVPSESELGMPIYPGVKTYIDATGMAVRPLTEGSMATAMLETPDPLDKVLDFYKERIKRADARGNAVPVTPREEKENNRRKVVLSGNDSENNVQMVQLREENGKTVIELMRTSVKSLPAGVSGGK